MNLVINVALQSRRELRGDQYLSRIPDWPGRVTYLIDPSDWSKTTRPKSSDRTI